MGRLGARCLWPGSTHGGRAFRKHSQGHFVASVVATPSNPWSWPCCFWLFFGGSGERERSDQERPGQRGLSNVRGRQCVWWGTLHRGQEPWSQLCHALLV